MDQPEHTLSPTLKTFITRSAGADRVRISGLRLLSGGSIQENWAFDAAIEGGLFAGTLCAILRADAPSGVAVSHSREHEFRLFKAAYDAGVLVPEPLWLGDPALLGRPCFVMRRIEGTAVGHQLVKNRQLGGNRRLLAERLGEELARIHSIRPPRGDLSFLPMPAQPAARALIERARNFLDGHQMPYPVLEWSLQWLEANAPAESALVLCHRDFRTGNYMVDSDGLTAILDWEFAGWSDPLEDIGWFCAKCWRFGNDTDEAGGIGKREDFYRGYERVSGAPLPYEQVGYWEVMAHLNWAIIAIQQADRHLSGTERSLNLALTGHMVPRLEWELLQMTELNNA